MAEVADLEAARSEPSASWLVRREVGLSRSAPPSVEAVVRSLLEDDALLDELEPLGKPGLHSLLATLELDGKRYVVKRYAYPFVLALRSAPRRSRAFREFRSLEALEALLPSPVRPVAWGERRTLGVSRRSVLVTELVEAVDLKACRLALLRGDLAGKERLLAALPSLLELVRSLHERGFFAANLFQKNVLWSPSKEGAAAFTFLDLPFARREAAPLAVESAIYDLACLDKDARMVLSRTERLRLYLTYQGRSRTLPQDRATLERLARERLRREHATPWSRFVRQMKKRVKRTFIGRFIVGRDPDDRHR